MTQNEAPELPHGEPRRVAAMFGRIAPRYDLLNHLLSFGIDYIWRRRAAGLAHLRPGDRALDIATGTGDLAFALARRLGHDGSVVGLDLVLEMLIIGRRKASSRPGAPADFHLGDAMRLPYRDGAFQAATMGFGGRNVPDLGGAFREMARVVAPGGRVVFLELSRPTTPGFRTIFDLYFHFVAPRLGGLISGHRSAYAYLPRSVDNFESVEEIRRLMVDAGLLDVTVHRQLFGAAVILVGTVR